MGEPTWVFSARGQRLALGIACIEQNLLRKAMMLLRLGVEKTWVVQVNLHSICMEAVPASCFLSSSIKFEDLPTQFAGSML